MPTADSSEPYGSILELVDVDYSYVGEFDCIHNDSIDNENYEELRTSFKASRIYVFVNGTKCPQIISCALIQRKERH